MKSEKGVTLTSLAIYIMLILIALITLTTITTYFRSNVNEFNTKTTLDIEFDKFNLYFIEEVKKTNNAIDETNSTENKVVFSSGNIYEFKENSIILNDNITIAEKIEAFTFSFTTDENNKQVVTVYMKVGDTERTNEYTLSNQTEDTVDNEDYIYGYKRAAGTNEVILDNSIKTNLKDYKIYGNSIQDGNPTPTTPVEIKSLGDKTINLFNFDKITGQAQGTPNYDDKSILLPSTSNMYTLGQSFTGAPTAFEKFNEVLNIDEPGYYCLMVKVTSDTENIETRAKWAFNINRPEGAVTLQPTEYTYKNGYLFGKFQFTEDILNSLKTDANTFRLYMYAFRTTDTLENVDVTVSDFMFVNGDYTYDTMPQYEPYGDYYKIPIKVSGKNLVNVKDIFGNNTSVVGLNITYNNDGSFNLSGTCNRVYQFPKSTTYELLASAEENLTYSVTYESDLALSIGAVYYKDNTIIYQSVIENGQSETKKLTSDINNIGLRFSDFVEGQYYEIKNIKVQVEKNDRATEYEPYVRTITTNIFLDEPLRKLGDSADYIDFENKKVVRNIGKVIWDGSENWGAYATGNGYLVNNDIFVDGQEVLCNRFVNSQSLTTNLAIRKNFNYAYCYGVASTYTSVEDWKNFLASNPIYVLGKLNSPTEELIELPNLQSFEGKTTFTVNTEIPPSNTEVVYYSK